MASQNVAALLPHHTGHRDVPPECQHAGRRPVGWRALRLLGLSLLAAASFAVEARAQSFNGSWSGTTSQGRAFSFVVQNNTITSLTVSFASVGACSTFSSTTTFTPGIPIAASAFSRTYSGGVGISLTVSGTFSSGTSASGTASITTSSNLPGGCGTGSRTVTWTAATTAPPVMTAVANVNQTTFAVGQTLMLSGSVTNPGLTGAADFFVGKFRPDGMIEFFTSTGGIAVGNAANLATFQAIATGVPLGAPFSVSVPNFHSSQWTGTEPRGNYVFFIAALTAGALSDGVLTANEILVLATAAFSFP